MNEVLEGLNAWGCDLEGALERFLGDEELYKSCLPMVAEDESFDGLKEALAADERKKAFDCAHTLKGVCSNLGFSKLCDLSSQLTEILRGRELKGYEAVLAQVEKQYQITVEAIRELGQ